MTTAIGPHTYTEREATFSEIIGLIARLGVGLFAADEYTPPTHGGGDGQWAAGDWDGLTNGGIVITTTMAYAFNRDDGSGWVPEMLESIAEVTGGQALINFGKQERHGVMLPSAPDYWLSLPEDERPEGDTSFVTIPLPTTGAMKRTHAGLRDLLVSCWRTGDLPTLRVIK